MCIEPVKNEFHSRLRFNRRGLVGMANNEGSGNMEFFFTLDATPELQNTHTIFGKVTGETIFNLIKLNESETDSNERPLYPHKINKVKILNNPFDDLTPRVEFMKSSKSEETAKKPKREGVKNFKLISFGDEAEMDEQEVESFPKDSEKSTKPPAEKEPKKDKKSEPSSSRPKSRGESVKPEPKKIVNEVSEDSDSDYETVKEKERMSELERKKKEIQDEIMSIKKQYQKGKKDRNPVQEEPEKPQQPETESEAVQDYLEEKEKYKKKKIDSKGASREDFTLQLLAKFKNKLHSALETQTEESAKANENSDDENWLAHKLDFSESQDAVLAKDASKKQDDWYDIYDPRNPLNKRKRGAEKEKSGSSSKRRH